MYKRQPKGKGVKSINVTARKTWNTFANKRDFRTLHGVDTVFSKAGIPIDITVVRENIEDTYGGIEHMLTHDVALSRRFITRPGSMQVIRYAFEMAKDVYKRQNTISVWLPTQLQYSMGNLYFCVFSFTIAFLSSRCV